MKKKRDIRMQPRGRRDLPPEKLYETMSSIWGEDRAAELMDELFPDQKKEEEL